MMKLVKWSLSNYWKRRHGPVLLPWYCGKCTSTHHSSPVPHQLSRSFTKYGYNKSTIEKNNEKTIVFNIYIDIAFSIFQYSNNAREDRSLLIRQGQDESPCWLRLIDHIYIYSELHTCRGPTTQPLAASISSYSLASCLHPSMCVSSDHVCVVICHSLDAAFAASMNWREVLECR